MAYNSCRHCGKDLLPENATIADGCGCNSGRGINHGLVATATCTCTDCDPDKTGGSRYVPIRITSMHQNEDTYWVVGICHCGRGANMNMAFTMNDGPYEPVCGKCSRGLNGEPDASGRYVKITKEMFDHFSVVYVMTA